MPGEAHPSSILVVDDDSAFAHSLASVLGSRVPGARVAVVGDGAAALQWLNENPCDLVLLDYRLPDVDGLDVLEALRRGGPHPAVVMVTGEGDETVVADLFRLGADDYLAKGGASPARIARTVLATLERRRLALRIREQSADLDRFARELDEKNRALLAANDRLRRQKERLHNLSLDLELQVEERTAELTRTTTFLNRVLDAATDHFIIAVGEGGSVLRFNRGAEELFGQIEGEVLGVLSLTDLFPGEEGAEDALVHAGRAGPFRQEWTGRRRSGEEFPCRVDVAPLWEGEGPRLSGVVVLGTEITAERAAQARIHQHLRSLEFANRELSRQYEEVRSATRVKSEFVASVSHELRTPLNAIIGYADLMRAGVYGSIPERQIKPLLGIHARSHDLLRLIEDVLEMARIDAGHLATHKERFSVSELVQESLELARLLLQGRELTLSSQVAPDVGDVTTDRRKLRQILFNLVGNAVKFTPEGSIAITAQWRDEGRLRLSVEDTGPGVDPSQQEAIFQPFQQGELAGPLPGVAPVRPPGTGLGLHIARSLARFLGGELTVESELGRGSRFAVEVWVE